MTAECFESRQAGEKQQRENDRRAKMSDAERQVDDQRIARERQIAEETRRRKAAAAAAARASAELARQRQVDAIASQLGPGNRAAAERLQRMNEEVAALRPKAKPPRQCTTRSFSQLMANTASTQAQASGSLSVAIARKSGANIGGSESVVSMTTSGAPVCSQRTQFYMKPPPVGNCLACIAEGMAIAQFGYVRGKGYPPPPTEWVCKATVQVSAESCGAGSSKVSNE